MRFLKAGISVTLTIGPFLDSVDGITAETALTIAQADVRLSKNAGTWAQKGDATSCTHQEFGHYSCPLSAIDTNTAGELKLAVAKTGALPVWESYTVLPAQVFDSIISGTDALDVNALQWAGAATATDDIALKATLAKGTDITGFTDVSAAVVADSVWDEARADHVGAGTFGQGAASVQGAVTGSVASVTGNVGGNVVGSVASVAAGGISATSFGVAAIDAAALATDAAQEIADQALDRADGVESGLTLRQALRLVTSALVGKLSGAATTTVLIRNTADLKTRVSATVDADGNRTAVSYDLT